MDAQQLKELPRIDQFRQAWQAFADCIDIVLSAPADLGREEGAQIRAIGQEAAKRALEIQLWAYDATHQPPPVLPPQRG